MGGARTDGLTEYELSHLVAHLAVAGREGDVHTLLRHEKPDRRNFWHAAKTRAGQTGGYVADLKRARALAEEDAEHPGCGNLGRQIRYALMIASMRSRARSTPPGFLAVLAGAGAMPVAEALSRLAQVPEEDIRVTGFDLLAACVGPESLGEVLSAVTASGDDEAREHALKDVVPRLPPELLPRVVEMLGPGDEGTTSILSKVVIRYAETGALAEALDLLGRFPVGYPWSADRAEAELQVAARLGRDRVGRLLAVPGSLWSLLRSPEGLSRLAGQWLIVPPDPCRRRPGQRGIHRIFLPPHFLGRFLRLLPEELRTELDAVAVAVALDDPSLRVELLAQVIPWLSPVARNTALEFAVQQCELVPTEAIDELGSWNPQEWARARLAPLLFEHGRPQEAVTQAQAAFEASLAQSGAVTYLPDGFWAGTVLFRLAQRLEPEARERITQDALDRALRSDERPVWMSDVIPWLPEPLRTETAARAWAETRSLEPFGAACVLMELVPLLPEEDRLSALREALARDPQEVLAANDLSADVRAHRLHSCLAVLRPDERQEFLGAAHRAAEAMEGVSESVSVRSSVGPYRSTANVPHRTFLRPEALLTVAACLTWDERPAIVAEAFNRLYDDVWAADLPNYLPWPLFEELPDYPEPLLAGMLALTEQCGDFVEVTVRHAVPLAAHFEGPLRAELLAVLPDLPDELRAQAAVLLSCAFAETDDLDAALETLACVPDDAERTEATAVALELYAAQGEPERVLHEIDAVGEKEGTSILRALMERASPEMCSLLVSAAQTMSPQGHGEMLLAAAERLSRLGRVQKSLECAQRAWDLAIGVGAIPALDGIGTTLPWWGDKWLAAEALRLLVRGQPAAGQRNRLLLARTLATADTLFIGRYAVLRGIARWLPADMSDVAVRESDKVADALQRSLLLAALARDDTRQKRHAAEALRLATRQRNGFQRARSLDDVAAVLPLSLVPRALRLIGRIADEEHRAEAARGLARRLVELGSVSPAVDIVMSLSANRRGWDEGSPRETAADGLPQALLRHGFLAEAEAVLDQLPQRNGWEESPRTEALLEMLPELTVRDPDTAWRLICSIGDRRDDLTQGVVVFATHVRDVPSRLRSWRSILRHASDATRDIASERLYAALPLTLALGGSEAAALQAQALRDVSRWWP
ncbi:hypothetical protein ACFYWX_31240 [Streptomyces sp. NPDC002888]|uniref:hypothetical protein n=1 Tax=Streptomyces sp. NPDC002888 TaxID=3364668 RepID=UPI00367D3AF6